MQEIVEGLRRLGLGSGDHVLVHSSLSSFGAKVEGGADALIDTILGIVGAEGTLCGRASGAPIQCSIPRGARPRSSHSRGALEAAGCEEESASLASWRPSVPKAEWLIRGHVGLNIARRQNGDYLPAERIGASRTSTTWGTRSSRRTAAICCSTRARRGPARVCCFISCRKKTAPGRKQFVCSRGRTRASTRAVDGIAGPQVPLLCRDHDIYWASAAINRKAQARRRLRLAVGIEHAVDLEPVRPEGRHRIEPAVRPGVGCCRSERRRRALKGHFGLSSRTDEIVVRGIFRSLPPEVIDDRRTQKSRTEDARTLFFSVS